LEKHLLAYLLQLSACQSAVANSLTTAVRLIPS